MRVVYISLIFLFSSCTNHTDYLKLAENEISQRIEQRFTIDNVNYWDLLYQLFNDNLEKKGYLVESDNKWIIRTILTPPSHSSNPINLQQEFEKTICHSGGC